MGKKRLKAIDFWKGITILFVLNIHTCFFSGSLYLPDWTRRISLLLDVPVFFFISGFLLQSPESKYVLSRGLRQFGRLIADYAVVAITVLVVTSALRALFGKQPLPEPELTIISILRFEPTGPLWSTWHVFGASMWFLWVYLSLLPLGIVALSFPSPREETLMFVSLITFSVFLLIVECYPSAPSSLLSFFRYISFYLSLFLAGAAFKRIRDRISIRYLLLVWFCLGILTFLVCYQTGTLPDLQAAKFPPSALYLLFSIHSVMMLSLLICLEEEKGFPAIPHRFFSFVSWCGRYTFRIYLWQGVATSVPMLFVPKMIQAGAPTTAIYGSALVWNFCVSLALASCHNGLETALMSAKKSQQSAVPDRLDSR